MADNLDVDDKLKGRNVGWDGMPWAATFWISCVYVRESASRWEGAGELEWRKMGRVGMIERWKYHFLILFFYNLGAYRA